MNILENCLFAVTEGIEPPSPALLAIQTLIIAVYFHLSENVFLLRYPTIRRSHQFARSEGIEPPFTAGNA